VVCSGLELGPTEVETRPGSTSPAPQGSGQDSQERAGQWAAAQGAANGSLPNGKQIASHFRPSERWGCTPSAFGRFSEARVIRVRS